MPDETLIYAIRDQIRREGPLPFARFMEQALYHPERGYYSSGRCAIGRRGDYFTSVSVGPLFGKLIAGQFVEIWEALDRPDDFVVVEQGAHHGEFACDVLEALRAAAPELYSQLRYRIVEPFAALRRRQEGVLREFADRLEWTGSIEEMERFAGVHFSNELLDAMPVHLLVSKDDGGELVWWERLVERTSCGFTFVDRPIADPRLRARLAKLPAPPVEGYQTEINLAMLDWIESLARKLVRGVILVADYGLTRDEFYAPPRHAGTLQCYADHRVLPSLLESVGESDLTTHVEWTSLVEEAERCGLTIAGFVDQHHFLGGLLVSHPELAAAGVEKSHALHTLIHPEFLGTRFQFLGLTKEFPDVVSLGGFRFGRDARARLGLVPATPADQAEPARIENKEMGEKHRDGEIGEINQEEDHELEERENRPGNQPAR
jgi:SAM-dependent MidA family methyltransferase